MGTELDALARIERARRTPARIREKHVTLSHGSGGKAMHDLIEAIFLRAFDNPLLNAREDQAIFAVEAGEMAITTDSYVVKPLFFPGGDIGALAVHGTVNDLAVSGALPLHLSAGFILEEGLEIEVLERVVASMAGAARDAGVTIVTGDTKVVERGKADGLYINTAGVGVMRRPSPALSAASLRPDDVVLVSGPVGDHGTAVLIARGELELESDLQSDTASLHGLVETLLDAVPTGVRALRDATRGGVATVLVEMAIRSSCAVLLDERAVPVRPEVRGACEILGLDPLYVANEGKLVAVVAPEMADAALAALRTHPLGGEAAIIGSVRAEPEGMVFLRTVTGGTRVVDMLAGEQLPRIC